MGAVGGGSSVEDKRVRRFPNGLFGHLLFTEEASVGEGLHREWGNPVFDQFWQDQLGLSKVSALSVH